MVHFHEIQIWKIHKLNYSSCLFYYLFFFFSCVPAPMYLPSRLSLQKGEGELRRGCVGTSRCCLHLVGSVYFGLLLWDSLRLSALGMESCLLLIHILIVCVMVCLMAMAFLHCHITGSQTIPQFLFLIIRCNAVILKEFFKHKFCGYWSKRSFAETSRTISGFCWFI